MELRGFFVSHGSHGAQGVTISVRLSGIKCSRAMSGITPLNIFKKDGSPKGPPAGGCVLSD